MNPQLKKYYIFLAASLVLSFGIQILLGQLGIHPMISIGITIAIFIMFPVLIRRRYMSNMSGYGNSGSGGGFFGSGSGGTGVRYMCLVCSNKHKGGACPRCGSKMQRPDF